MANNRQIKNRIVTAKNISKITKAMEMVAASKMKKAQDQALSARPYAQALAQSLQTVSKVATGAHPLLSSHEEGSHAVVVISTDKGLCGSFNGQLLKSLSNWKKEHSGELKIIVIGKKAVLFTRSLGLTVHAQFTELPEEATSSDIIALAKLVTEGFLIKEFKTVDIIYMDFINTLSQQAKKQQLLPLSSFEKDEKDLGFELKGGNKEYLFEPSASAILNKLLPYYIENTLYQLLLESRASEHSARMVAMKNASENAQELVDELKLIFNKSRQQAITSELLDIATATLVL
jgi:F-type H+-transporting ATPase subunit gamma